ncbi:lipase 3-like [Cydia pomonella]|uniref:lipase 3-like n=1 Tax=Cydia pomonella TaxID=82600 RepID=UPI002ADDD121|nr:lipase 3-like [Cydia pomonella]
MFLKRRSVFVLLLCLQIVSSVNSGEEATKNKSDSNSTFTKHTRRLKKTKTRSLKLTQNPKANLIALNDKGRFLKSYDIVTCDGYILNIFRTTFEIDEPKHKEFPVVLVPGLYQSSDRFVRQNTEHSLAFILQDLGYDVWLANVRGTKYGRRHLYLESETDESTQFFDYSYDEIGFYDIAVIVDYVLNDTRKEKVHYIGHSLGGTAFLVLNTIKPEFNNKFETAHLMAPIGYQNYFPNTNFTKEVDHFKEIFEDLIKSGKAEIFPPVKDDSKNFSVDECLGDKKYQNICEALKINELMGLEKYSNSKDKTRGGSIKLLAHLAQNIKYKTFNRWDYGEEENMNHYKIKQTPIYNISHITAPTMIVYSLNDEFVSPKDIKDMAKNMVKASTREVKRKDFKHQDFLLAPDVMETVYKDIIEDLRNTGRLHSEGVKELRKEHPNDDDEYEDDPSTIKPDNNGNTMKGPKNNMKLFIPPSVWMTILIWLPRLIIPIVLTLCLMIFFCCVKKFNVNFNVGMRGDKKSAKQRGEERENNSA